MHLECLKSFLWHFQKQPISYYAMPFLEPWATYSWMLFFSQRAKGRQRCVLYGPVTVHDVSWQSYSFLVLDLTFWIVLWCDVRFFRENKTRWQPLQILTALEYVHSLRLIHCDLKPARAPVFGCGLHSEEIEETPKFCTAPLRRIFWSSRTAGVRSRPTKLTPVMPVLENRQIHDCSSIL